MFKETVGKTAITFSGTLINGILGLIFYILVARFLGPANFGILSVAIATLALIADVADFGTDTGLIRFIGKYFRNDKEKALRIMKLGLKIKLVVWLVILIVGWFFAPFLAVQVFTKPEISFPFQLSLVGVGGALLFSFVVHSLQAMQKFAIWSFLSISLNGLRLLLIVLIGFSLTLENVLLVYIIVPFLGFFLGLLFMPKFLGIKNENSLAKEFFHYNKWVAVVSILAAFSARLDTFISAKFVSSTSLGIYAAANQLASIVPQLVVALAAVIAPKFAGFNTKTQAMGYLKKIQLLVIGIAILGFLAIPSAAIFIPIFYGSLYNDSIKIFTILLISQLVFLIATPLNQAILYYFAKPQLFIFISLGQLLIMSIIGWFLTSNFGIQGAAFTVLTAGIFSLLISAFWVIYRFKIKL